jgi:Domain of unknown function (DUF4258)
VSRIIWTKHALLMMQERDIMEDWVIQTINMPQHQEVDLVHSKRMRAYRRIETRADRWLRVVYEEQDEVVTVVTVFLDRKAGNWA